MSQHVPRGLAQFIRDLARFWGADPRSDAELLAAFAESGDAGAFAILVSRHGQTVWVTCQRALGNDTDAEDAFQAAFIALARSARMIRAESIAAWLRTTSNHVARDVLKTARRRAAAHRRLCERATTQAADPSRNDEVRIVVNEEMTSLPERLRVPLALYYLDGKTQVEVGRLLGITDRAVAGRLRRGLDALRAQLARRGMAVTAVTLAAVLGDVPVATAVPNGLVTATTEAALTVAAGGQLMTTAAQLALGVAPIAGVARLKLYGLLVVAAIGSGVGMAAALQPERAARPQAVAPLAAAPSAPAVPVMDSYGDPLPDGAVARIGSTRFRAAQAGLTEDVAFLPDGKFVVSVHGGSEIAFWDVSSGLRTRLIAGPHNACAIELAPDGRRLVVAGSREVWAWDLAADGPKLRWKWQTELDRGLGATALAYSPDNRLVAVGDPGGDRTVLLDAARGEPVAALKGGPLGLAFAPDGATIATAIRDDGGLGRFVFWNPVTAEPVRQIGVPGFGGFTDFAFSPNGQTFAWVEARRATTVIEAATGREIAFWPGANSGLSFSPDGNEVISIGFGKIQFFDPKTGIETRPALSTPGLAINRVKNPGVIRGKRLSSDGKYLATIWKGAVAVWDVANGRLTGPPRQIPVGVRKAEFSPDGRTVATFAEVSADVTLWDAETGAPLRRLVSESKPDDHAYGLKWLADGKLLTLQRAVGELRSPLRLVQWNARTGASHETATLPEGIRIWSAIDKMASLTAERKNTAGSAESGQDMKPRDILARRAGGWQAAMRTVTQINVIDGLAPFVASPSGERIVMASEDRIFVVDSTGRLVRRLKLRDSPSHSIDCGEEPEASIHRIVMSADGRTVAAVTQTRETSSPSVMKIVKSVSNLWDLESGRSCTVTLPPKEELNLTHCDPAVSADGRYLAAATQDRAIVVAEVSPGTGCRRLPGDRLLRSLAFSPDGHLLAAGDTEGGVVVWNLTTGCAFRRFAGHRRDVVSLSFAPGGNRLASSSDDGTVLIWDTTDVFAR